MDERKQKVLRAIITDYINTAEPVGSRTVAKKYDLGVSSATIRNEMSDLEELGLLEQPHTSAGRIPSPKGYRYYVDYLIDKAPLPKKEKISLDMFFGSYGIKRDSFYEEACKMLADVSPYVSMVMIPKRSRGAVEQLQLLPVTPQNAVLILVTDTGIIHHETIDLPVPVSVKRLNEISEILLMNLKGKNIEEINGTLMKHINDLLAPEKKIVEAFFELMNEATHIGGEEKIIVDGILNLLNQPEFNDANRIKELFTFLRRKDAIRQMLLAHTGDGMDFAIGDELAQDDLKRCSIVTCSYDVDGGKGYIGLLGPTRMKYAYSASLARETAQQMSAILKMLK